ncbi:YbdK family carboxylate-amine ligase [Georgenia sp. Z1491]|uniref:YbdK family carboxylate-amine ligase n=1 Tax=Georgenia sp. Z1491 TaxID=3416707 RepID=UPI003CF1182D
MPVEFGSSERSSLGVEWELQVLDAATGEPRDEGPALIDDLRSAAGTPHPRLAHELLASTVEIVTGVHATVASAVAELAEVLDELVEAAGRRDLVLSGGGAHATADPQAQPVAEGYERLIARTAWWGREMLIYGLHVHVGVEDRHKAVPLVGALLQTSGPILALSASSPAWRGVGTGYASNRTMIFQQLPTAGLPDSMATWSDYERIVEHLLAADVIARRTETRWDARPTQLGTVESRICDSPPTIAEVAALTALNQCVVEDSSTRLDAGEELPALPRWLTAENRWRAARFGLDATFVTDTDGGSVPATEAVRRLVADLAPTAERLGCADDLALVEHVLDTGASYRRQLAAAEQDGWAAVPLHLAGELTEERRPAG